MRYKSMYPMILVYILALVLAGLIFDDPANSVQIKEGGYYYITAGYDAFQQSGKTNYCWYGPINYMDQVGWKEI